MLKFEIDRKKIMIEGSGSVTTYCKRKGIDYRTLYNVLQSKRTRFEDGSKSQAVVDKLIHLGVGEWVETPDETLSA